MNVPFLVAGLLAVTAASIHGILGERIVVTKLPLQSLPSTRFGSPSFTMVMIRATWHITTIAFLVMGPDSSRVHRARPPAVRARASAGSRRSRSRATRPSRSDLRFLT